MNKITDIFIEHCVNGEHSHHEEIRTGNGAELEERLKMMERKADEKPYDHCWDCEMSEKNGGPCKVHDKYQRFVRCTTSTRSYRVRNTVAL